MKELIYHNLGPVLVLSSHNTIITNMMSYNNYMWQSDDDNVHIHHAILINKHMFCMRTTEWVQ